MQIARIGLDLAKYVFEIHGVDARGKTVLRKTIRRHAVSAFFANLPSCLVGMEASNGAHFWAKALSELGHDVRLISPQFVTPYVKSNKNDRNDAEAICEAALRHDANDASLSRIADDLIGVREAIERIDHAQDALLQNGQSLQGQLEALTGQITHMIQVLTLERPEQEGPSLADLLARILTQQSGMAAMLRQINDALTRLAPAEAAAVANANIPANGAGRA
jgi:transposase